MATPYFPDTCTYKYPNGNPITLTANVDGWVAPNIPEVPPCCEMPQQRNWTTESILWGLMTVVTPMLQEIIDNTAGGGDPSTFEGVLDYNGTFLPSAYQEVVSSGNLTATTEYAISTLFETGVNPALDDEVVKISLESIEEVTTEYTQYGDNTVFGKILIDNGSSEWFTLAPLTIKGVYISKFMYNTANLLKVIVYVDSIQLNATRINKADMLYSQFD